MKKLIKYSVITLMLTLVAFGFYVNDYYKAVDVVVETSSQSTVTIIDNMTLIEPIQNTDTAMIFYPGAKVEHTAYFPILSNLASQGIACVLIDMPFNMAIFDVNAADDALKILTEYDKIYIAGHSMGGAMASSYASKNPDKIDGLILLGAYIYGDYPDENALTIYGSYNDNLESKMNYTENIVKIEGGNHAGFGNYGSQKGDPDGDITADEQQQIAVDAIIEFITEKSI